MKAGDIQDLIDRLGPETQAFGRWNPQNRDVEQTEVIDFGFASYDAIGDGRPEPPLDLPLELEKKFPLPNDLKFIWLIFLDGDFVKFLLIADSHPNQYAHAVGAGRKNVCHTNLSGGREALQGGECWWCEDSKTMWVNSRSGRFGARTSVQWEAVLEFFRLVYKHVEPLE